MFKCIRCRGNESIVWRSYVIEDAEYSKNVDVVFNIPLCADCRIEFMEWWHEKPAKGIEEDKQALSP